MGAQTRVCLCLTGAANALCLQLRQILIRLQTLHIGQSRRVFDLAAMDHVTHGNLGDFARAGPRNVVHGNHFGGRMPGGCALANAGFDKLD